MDSFRWLIVPTLLFASSCVAPEPVLSSVASLVSFSTLATEVLPSWTTVTPVSGPIAYVPVTATAPRFCGTLDSEACSALYQPTPSVFSDASQIITASPAVDTGPADKNSRWPGTRGSIQLPGFRLFLTILEYGFPIVRDLEEDIVSDLALLATDFEKVDPNGLFPATTLKKKLVELDITPRNGTDLRNREVVSALTTISALTKSDGPRMIKMGFISRGVILIGQFSLRYISNDTSGKPEPSQKPSISTQVWSSRAS